MGFTQIRIYRIENFTEMLSMGILISVLLPLDLSDSLENHLSEKIYVIVRFCALEEPSGRFLWFYDVVDTTMFFPLLFPFVGRVFFIFVRSFEGPYIYNSWIKSTLRSTSRLEESV